MTAFLDSSALVKRYADEDGADLVRRVTDPVVMCSLARVEVPAALWRKHRMAELSAEDARLLSSQFARDHRGAHSELIVTTVDGPVLDRAMALVAIHPLRAYDAVQLAAALVVDETLGGSEFGCFDAALSAAASAEGLQSAWS